jgi:hypothetical protein
LKLPAIAYVYILSIVAAFFLGSIRIKKLDRGMNLFFWFIVLNLLTEIITFILSRYSMNNYWVLHIYDLLEYCILILMFSNWQVEQNISKILRSSIPFFILFWVFSKFTIESISALSNYVHPAACLIFIIVSILTLYQLGQSELSKLAKVPRYWIVSGILLFFAGSIMFYLLENEFAVLQYIDAIMVMNVHWSVGLLVNAMYSIGFYMVK